MMIQEFEQLTGLHPTTMEYAVIEDMYYDFKGDKDAFCKDFLERGRMVEALRKVNDQTAELFYRANAHRREAEEKVSELEAKVRKLEADLEKAEGWKPYEDPHNVKQGEYEKLLAAGAKVMDDDEAADMIAEEFGFERSRITIIHEVPKEEVNRRGAIRKAGVFHRESLYEATDWNYIRFDVRGNVTMAYEMCDGEIQIFWR